MDLLEQSWRFQGKVEEKVKGVGRGKYGRVLKMAKKPSSDEYKKTLQITSIGSILIGGLGFLIYFIWEYGPPFFRSALGL